MTGNRAADWRTVRVGDAERDEAARQLGEHYAVGRLTTDEFDDRLGRAYAARTGGDIHAVLADLPRPKRSGSTRPRRSWLPRLPAGRTFRTLAAAGLLAVGLVAGFGVDRALTGAGYPPAHGMHGPFVEHFPQPHHGAHRP